MSVHAQNILTLDDHSSLPRTNWDRERVGLFADGLRLGGRVRLEVHGESMLPALWPAETVEIESCSIEHVRVDDIVLAQRDGRLFLHRVIMTCATGFTLRGESVPNPDPPFRPDALLGRLASHRHKLFVSIPVLSRVAGLVLCHFGLLRRLALKVHARRANKAREFPGLELSK